MLYNHKMQKIVAISVRQEKKLWIYSGGNSRRVVDFNLRSI